MPIVWTDSARARLAPTRRDQVSAGKSNKPETVWAAIRKSLAVRGKYDPIDGTFVKGRTLSTPELSTLMERCEVFARNDDFPTIDDIEVAAVFLALVSKHAHGHPLAFLLATTSVPFAFEAHLHSRDYDVTPRYVNWNDPFRLIAAPADTDQTDLEWRRTLLAQPDEIRAECKKIADKVMARNPNIGQRTTLAYAFFDEEKWAADVCRDWIARGLRRHIPLNEIVTDFDTAIAIIRNKDSSWNYMPLVERFGERMLPALVEMATTPFDRYHARDVGLALTLFDDPAAAAAMVKLLQQASSRPLALEYFAKYPHHAEAALASIETMKGRAAKIAKEVLAGAQRAASNAISPDDEARPEELPRVLAKPPWLDEKKPRKPVTNLALERLALPETIDWQAGERERALTFFPRPDAPATKETLEAYAQQRAEGKFVDVVKHKNEALPDDVILEAWNSGQKTYGGTLVQKIQHIMSRFGDTALPGLSFFVEHLANGWGDAVFLLRVKSWRLALPLAHHIAHRRIGKLAWQWLQRHAELAVLSLVPVAFGDDKDERAIAERALFRLRASGVDVVEIGARYGKETKAALEKLFSWDPLYDLPKTIPKLGASWHPESLTRPRLTNGKFLPISALDTIATMLAFSPLDPPYAGLVQVKEVCEPRSLAEFSWEMARAWEHAGHKKKEVWMLMSLVQFADDEVVRRMTPGVRVDFAVQVLEVIATDAALMEMATIAGRTLSQGSDWTLGGRIEKLLEAAAESRGVTKDELEEDLAPTSELEADGSLVLDFGPRQLQVGFDESLNPYVKGASGARGKALPPSRKDDDPEKAERAKTIWRDLKEDVAVIASRRIRALERALTSGRTWPRERFVRVWLDHRLMKHLARGVLWVDTTAPEPIAFRVAEDGTLSNVDDAPHALAENAKIGVAHPLKMKREEVERWRTLFEDYKIVQPFAQLGRTYIPVAAETTRLAWPFAGVTVSDLTQRLQLRGFERGPYVQGKYTYHRRLKQKGSLHVEFKNAKAAADETTLVFMIGTNEIPASDLDPIDLADAIYDLQG